jgi:hypothetical protein
VGDAGAGGAKQADFLGVELDEVREPDVVAEPVVFRQMTR